MKHYDDGKEMVAALLKNYWEVYKRKKDMMKELEECEITKVDETIFHKYNRQRAIQLSVKSYGNTFSW